MVFCACANRKWLSSFRCLRSLPTTRLEMAKKKVEDKTNQSSDNTKNDTEMGNTDEEPNFDDPEGYVDSVTDEGTFTLI